MGLRFLITRSSLTNLQLLKNIYWKTDFSSMSKLAHDAFPDLSRIFASLIRFFLAFYSTATPIPIKLPLGTLSAIMDCILFSLRPLSFITKIHQSKILNLEGLMLFSWYPTKSLYHQLSMILFMYLFSPGSSIHQMPLSNATFRFLSYLLELQAIPYMIFSNPILPLHHSSIHQLLYQMFLDCTAMSTMELVVTTSITARLESLNPILALMSVL